MKGTPRLFLPALACLALSAGCGHLDLAPPGDPSRVLTGTVEFEAGTTLPEDAVLLVRVLDVPQTEASETHPAMVQTLKRPVPPPDAPPEVLGEKSISNPGASPVAYRVEYTADDEQLRRGLNVEARISYGGKVRYLNSNHYSIGMNDYNDPHAVWVDPVSR